MLKYKVEGDEIKEIADGKVTASWKRGDISDGVKIQLITRGGKEIEDFFNDLKPEAPLARVTVEKLPAKLKAKKKVVRKRK